MIAVVELKKYVASTCIFCIILYKLRHEEKLCQVILLLINKNLAIYFNYLILFLSLVICQKIKGNKEFLVDVKKIK